MKRLLKILLTLVVAILLTFWITIQYFKYDLKKTLTEEQLSKIIADINSAHTLPQSFKDTYSKVYPRAFKTNFATSSLWRRQQVCECGAVANQIWLSHKTTRIGQHLEHIAFVLTLEDNISEEKCFEYRVANFDFLYGAIGAEQAATTYFDKSLDSLTIDEQLGLILKLRNSSLYNLKRRPDIYTEGIKDLKEKIHE